MLNTLLLLAANNWFSGNQLYSECAVTKGEPGYYQSSAICRAYIEGVDDGAALTGRPRFCLPDAATAGQTRDVVVYWLQRHPEDRHFTAASLVVEALAEAFPCKP